MENLWSKEVTVETQEIFCIFFPQKVGTIFARKLISGTHTVGAPVPSNDITIFF
jgi:hypothetical protein